MKVILLQNIEKLGKKFEVKNVKTGYARNFLIPRNLAKQATKETIKWLEVKREIDQKKDEEALKKTQSIVAKINGLEFIFPMKVGDKGQLFESLTAQKIKEALSQDGFNISKEQIYLKNPIKKLGEFPIKINFDHNLEGIIKVIITEEK